MKRRIVILAACLLVLVGVVTVSAQNGASLVRKDVGVAVYPSAQFDEPLSQYFAIVSAPKGFTLPPGTGFAMYVTTDDITKVAAFYKKVFPGEDMEIKTTPADEARKDMLKTASRATNPTHKANLQAMAAKITDGKAAVATSMQKGKMVLVALSSPITDVPKGQLRQGTQIWISVQPQQ